MRRVPSAGRRKMRGKGAGQLPDGAGRIGEDATERLRQAGVRLGQQVVNIQGLVERVLGRPQLWALACQGGLRLEKPGLMALLLVPGPAELGRSVPLPESAV
jgi:hypothetical protein